MIVVKKNFPRKFWMETGNRRIILFPCRHTHMISLKDNKVSPQRRSNRSTSPHNLCSISGRPVRNLEKAKTVNGNTPWQVIVFLKCVMLPVFVYIQPFGWIERGNFWLRGLAVNGRGWRWAIVPLGNMPVDSYPINGRSSNFCLFY